MVAHYQIIKEKYMTQEEKDLKIADLETKLQEVKEVEVEEVE